jgi:acyl-CoA reductase-like NAD-dependent aldehyde dehydrogenase
MATVEQRATATGSTNGDGIRVENPATGEIIGSVPNRSAARWRRSSRAHGRPSRRGRRSDSPAVPAILRRAQKWVMDNSDRLIATIVSETGKTYEDAQLAEISYVASAFGFWAKAAPRVPGRREDQVVQSVRRGPQAHRPLPPARRGRRHRPVELPAVQLVRRLHPALAAGNACVLKPSEVTPLSSLVIDEMARDIGMPEHVFSVATGDGETAPRWSTTSTW